MAYNHLLKEIRSKKYRFAKTMPQIPHEYSRKVEWKNDELFEKAVIFIRKFGKKELFMGREYTYLYMYDYKYWTMNEPLEKVILINRAKI